MSSCGACNSRMNSKKKVKCKLCAVENCNTCVGIEESQLINYHNGVNIWLCNSCMSKALVVSTASSSHNNDNAVAMSSLCTKMDQLLLKHDNLAHTVSNFQKDISIVQNKLIEHDKTIDDNKHSIANNEVNLNVNMVKTDELEKCVRLLEEENLSLKAKLNDAEKQMNINSLEITGVPEPRGENIMVTVRQLCLALGFTYDSSMFVNCYRQRIPNSTSTSKIIMKFIKKCDKDEMLHCRKVKRNFSTKDLPKDLSDLLKEHNMIYINEILTQVNKKLFMKAKEFKKKNDIKFLWTKNGNIYMRRTEDSHIVAIKTDLNFNEI